MLRSNESAYALPSILLLITILTMIAGSVVAMQFFVRRLSLGDIALVQAEWAAESGIAESLASGDASYGNARQFRFNDGSESSVMMHPWGLWDIAVSEGRSRWASVVRRAIVAQYGVTGFEKALVFGNRNHQLVLAGSSHIKGDVAVGLSGVTTGSLRGRRTPPQIPIEGGITKGGSNNIPAFSMARLQMVQTLFRENIRSSRHSVSPSTSVFNIGDYPDSLGTLALTGNIVLQGEVLRRQTSLMVVVNGSVSIAREARLLGLVAILASEKITIHSGAVLEHGLLVAGDSIYVGGTLSAQLVAPAIRVAPGTLLSYPSVVMCMPVGVDSTSLSLLVASNATVEGFVGMFAAPLARTQDNILVLEQGATVTGAVYCTGALTLDGTVVGSVLTKEFFFNEAPTTYFGWIRTGRIDRSTLPDGFLLPVGFEGAQYEVMDWL